MKLQFGQKIKSYIKKNILKSKWNKFLFFAAIIVIIATFYVLIRPGLTLQENEHIYWLKINSVDEINSGDVFIIANSTSTKSFSFTNNNTEPTTESITLTQKGTQNNQDYYDITWESDNNNNQWVFNTTANGYQFLNYQDPSKGIKLTSYQSSSRIETAANATTNNQIEKTNNNYFYIYRSSENGNTGSVYYITCNNDAFTITTGSSDGSYLNLYKQIIVEEIPEEPPEPVVETHWVQLISTDNILAGKKYVVLDMSQSKALAVSGTTFGATDITLTNLGNDINGNPYYSITGDSFDENSQWMFGTDTTVGTMYSAAESGLYIRHTTYYEPTYLVAQNNASNNITLQKNSDNTWKIVRASEATSGTTYYISYANNAFTIVNSNTTNTNFYIYMEEDVTIQPDPDNPNPPGPTEPEEEYWIKILDTADITAGDEYLICYTATDNCFAIDSNNNPINKTITKTVDHVTEEITYYKTEDATDESRWIFGVDETIGTIKNVGKNSYIKMNSGPMGSDNTGYQGTITLANSNYTNNITAIIANSQYWNIGASISGTNYYIKYNDDIDLNGSWDDNQWNISSGQYCKALDIFKLVTEDEEPIYNPTIEEDISGDEADSGKLMADKNVTYNKNTNIFTVELSALGQDYDLTNELGIKENLLDVVFVVDNSQTAYTLSNTGETLTRNNTSSQARTYVSAINSMITQLNALNPDNRIAVVAFNNTATTLLTLDSYTSTNNTYLSATATFSNGNFQSASMSTTTYVRNSSGNTVSTKTQNSANNKYTQVGISTGAKLLTAADTTRTYNYTYSYNDGTTEQITKTVQRTPIIVLFNNGIPTRGSTTYNNPPASVTSSTNSDSYNVVRTAKYFKDSIETHYFGSIGTTYKTGFYTILTPSSSTDNATKNLLTASLTPNRTNVRALPTSSGSTGYNFRNSMQNDSNYSSNNNYYLYNTDIFNNSTFTSNGLATTFTNWLPENPEHEYGLKIKDNLVITDYIGDGMEIKSTPILNINNTDSNPTNTRTRNNTTTYTYQNNITAAVTTNNNLQTIVLTIPEAAIPLVHTGSSNSTYPLKLKFNVGLNATAQEEVDNQDHGTLTYYTNKFDDVTANASYSVTTTNPYFSAITTNQTKPKINSGVKEILTTSDYSWWMNANNKNIQYLGNNGKFEQYIDAIEVTANAIWAEDDNHTRTRLYVYVKDGNTITPLLDKNGNQYEFNLTLNGNWEQTIYLPTPVENQDYYITQNPIDGYRTSYTNSETLLLNSETTKMGKIIYDNNKQATVTVTNLYGTVLPNTGGIGTTIFYITGIFILLKSIYSIIKNKNTY